MFGSRKMHDIRPGRQTQENPRAEFKLDSTPGHGPDRPAKTMVEQPLCRTVKVPETEPMPARTLLSISPHPRFGKRAQIVPGV